ncbi:MAG: DUF4168 domain-containing protein [Pseudomonadota bacterium]
MKTRISLAVMAVVALAAASPTVSQEADAAPKQPVSLSQVTPDPALTPDTITDDKIVSFVEALAAIQIVGRHYTPRIDAETDGSKRAELIDLANRDIVRAVDTIVNITPAEYVAIDKAAQQDQGLNQRILAQIEVAQAEAKARKEAEGVAKDDPAKDE